MNIVKKAHPFVDLLKPEVAAVASVLLAIDKETFKKVDLSDAFPLLRDKYKGSKITGDLLGPDVELSTSDTEDIAKEVANKLLGERLSEAIREHQAVDSEEDLLIGAGTAMAAGKSATESTSDDEGTLGVGSYVDLFASWVGLVPRSKGLRLALADWIADDKTFDVTYVEKDTLYEGMLGLDGRNKVRISEDVDFVVTGHSHLARAKEFAKGRYYFNCGTWIRLLQLTPESVGSQELFDEKVWPVLKSGNMTDLDNAKIPGPNGENVPLVRDRTNAVHITRDGNKIKGTLLRISDGADGSLAIEAERDNDNENLEPFFAS
jgi:3',5'-cyclic AMP phosphodiesterase CpdA